jgi:predicted amidophosphoribosyltransferase
MNCTDCGNSLQDGDNFCRRCGSEVAPIVVAQQETKSRKFWKRLGQAVVWQLQQQAIANAQRQQQSGDNPWSSATASGNDNGQSGYVDVGGSIVGYDR